MLRLLLATAAILFALGRVFMRLEVEGRSMLPAYAPGDRFVASRLDYWLRPPAPGEVVVVRQPSGRLDLKRIAAGPGDEVRYGGQRRSLAADEYWLLGDNDAESTDSRVLGPVRRRDIVARAWFRY